MRGDSKFNFLQHDFVYSIFITHRVPKDKKSRKANWTDDETLHLLSLIKERKHILKGDLSKTLTAKKKQQTWDDIASLINASHPMVHRTKADIEKRWYKVLSKAKETLFKYKEGVTGTGKLALNKFYCLKCRCVKHPVLTCSLTIILVRCHILGEVAAWLYVIEFQKRGLPHAHFVLIFTPQYSADNDARVDELVTAEIPEEVV